MTKMKILRSTSLIYTIDDVWGDFLVPSQGTTPAAVIATEIKTVIL